MKSTIPIVLFTLLQMPLFAQVSEHNDPKKHPSLTNKTTIRQIHNKPIDYYLAHPAIGETAKLFYKGEYAIYDDAGTFSIIDSVLTENEETQFFYFHLFNEILKISDGAISEYISSVCTNYIRRRPCNFLRYSDDMILEIDLDKWISLVSFDLLEEGQYQLFTKSVDQQIKSKCVALAPKWDGIKDKIRRKLTK